MEGISEGQQAVAVEAGEEGQEKQRKALWGSRSLSTAQTSLAA